MFAYVGRNQNLKDLKDDPPSKPGRGHIHYTSVEDQNPYPPTHPISDSAVGKIYQITEEKTNRRNQRPFQQSTSHNTLEQQRTSKKDLPNKHLFPDSVLGYLFTIPEYPLANKIETAPTTPQPLYKNILRVSMSLKQT